MIRNWFRARGSHISEAETAPAFEQSGGDDSSSHEAKSKFQGKLVTALGPPPQQPVIMERGGRLIESHLIYKWTREGKLEKGWHLCPIQCHTENAYGFATLHLLVNDLEFALKCFRRAQSAGQPSPDNLECKAFIFSGVIAYARAFATGVRGLNPAELFAGVWNDDDKEIHQYLMDLRNKHIAHSVNEYEHCDAAGMVVLDANHNQIEDGVAGVGVVLQESLGISPKRLERAMHQAEFCQNYLQKKIDQLRGVLYREMEKDVAENGWKIAPLVRGMFKRLDASEVRTGPGPLDEFADRLKELED